MGSYATQFRTDFAESGDDPYFKPSDGSFDTWDDGNVVAAIEIGRTGAFTVNLDSNKAYIGYVNAHSLAFTVDVSTNVITTSSAHGLSDGASVRFKGLSLPAPLTQTTLYFVRDVTNTTFRVSATPGGAAIDIATAGSGAMAITAPSKRSPNDSQFTVIPQLAAASLTGEAEESLSDSIVAALKADPDLGTAGLMADAALAAAAASAVNNKLGTPAGASVSSDIAEVKTSVDGVIKSGEPRIVSRPGKSPVTYTETRD